jgi:hypothetical protein
MTCLAATVTPVTSQGDSQRGTKKNAFDERSFVGRKGKAACVALKQEEWSPKDPNVNIPMYHSANSHTKIKKH